MKLSAPPPPPPPPPEEPAGEQPNANTPPVGATTPEVPPPEPPPPAPATKTLQWPTWYSGVDSALVALVLLFAFAAASFVARNSDVWIHLASGKRLLAGQYTPGSDPFSYSGADRPWVNHSWLADAVAYLFYGGQGKLLVIVKALVIALTFGLLIAIRRPKFALWPWAAVACVAVLACAPYMTLRPQVVSMLFLAVTLYLLFAVPHKPDSWRFPIAIGITFWLWSNSDTWFFIGPMTLALAIIGDLIQTKLLNSSETPATPGTEANTPAAAEEPLGSPPDTLTLAKALGIGVLACMLNPHHVRVWELPFELTGAAGIEIDPRLRQLTYSPVESDYYTSAGLGQSPNGLAYAILFVGGAAVLGFGYGRVRVAHLALWIGFAALSLKSIYAIPFFAIVAVPLVAAQLNSLSSQVELKTWGDPRSRLFLVGSSSGRVLSVVAVCALCVLAYPGWIHAEVGNPAAARRFAWGVEAEPGLQQAAEQFQQWHASGQLPADAHGVITNTDLANYLAWFAPQSKVFINARYNHHRQELPDYVAMRKGFGLIGSRDDRPNPQDATDVLKKVNADYVAIEVSAFDPSYTYRRAGEATSMLYRAWDVCSPWYTDGRTTVFGWHTPGTAPKSSFAALRLDPVMLAFGPGVARLPEPEIRQPPPVLGWEEAFVRPVKPTPLGVAEAMGWAHFKEGPMLRQMRRQVIREGLLTPLALSFPNSLALGWLLQALPRAEEAGFLRFPPAEPGTLADAAALKACALLSLRAARQAIAADPDHPESYFALAKVLQDPDLPLTESERAIGIVTAYRQCLVRLPSPERYKRGQFVLIDPVDVALQLANGYLGRPVLGRIDPKTQQRTILGFIGMSVDMVPFNQLGQAVVLNDRGEPIRVPFGDYLSGRFPQSARLQTGNTPYFLSLDGAREALKVAQSYAAVELTGDATDAVKKRAEGIEKVLKDVENAIIRANDQYNQVKGRSLPLMVEVTLRNGLTEETLKLLSDKDAVLRDYKAGEGQAVLLRITLELVLGRIEEADVSLSALSTPEQADILDRARLTQLVQLLKYQKCLHAGEYKTAGELFEAMGAKGIGIEPVLADIAKAKISPNEMLFALTAEGLPFPGGVGPTIINLQVMLARAGRAISTREQISDHLQNEAKFFFRRGLLLLMEGDIAGAKQRFLQTNRKAPPGWFLPDVGHSEARHYLQLIEMAEKKTPAP